MPKPQPKGQYVAGVDWGLSRSYTAIVVLDEARRAVVAWDRFRGMSWTRQQARLQAMHARWGLRLIRAESNSMGSPNIEALQQAGLPLVSFQTTATSKRALIDALALAIERKQIALLPDETLLNELASYRAQLLPGGGVRYGAPPGLHDDLVMALALAWHGLQHGGRTLDFA